MTIGLFLVPIYAVQFRENIEQDQGKSDFLRKQIRDLEKTIADSRRRLSVMEEGLKEYGKLKEIINIKESERKMLKNKKDEQFQALRDECTGRLLVSCYYDIVTLFTVVTVRSACSNYLRK